MALDLEGIAHPEDSFAYDLMPHRREFHREKLLRKIQQWSLLRPTMRLSPNYKCTNFAGASI